MIVKTQVFWWVAAVFSLAFGFAARPGSHRAVHFPEHASQDPVTEFYQLHNQKAFWFAQGDHSVRLRQAMKSLLDSAWQRGLNPQDYLFTEMAANVERFFRPGDSLECMEADRLFTEAAINFYCDLYAGRNIGRWISSDEISPEYARADLNRILSGLLHASSDTGLFQLADSLEPYNPEYHRLASALKKALASADSGRIQKLSSTLNFYRWVHHFRFAKFAVINIPSAHLRFYDNDSPRLRMKVVVGKPATKTPRIATYCNEVILYPYWYVPRKIVLKEYLPLFKKNPSMADSLNMQIIDGRGRIMDPVHMPWKEYNKQYFPYELRQSTGCDNALGVIKFNLTDPYDVFMHDTNFKRAFSSDRRFYSHGCIRLEHPIPLANYVLDNPLDSQYLQSCLRDQKPVSVKLGQSLPVFVVYMTAEADSSGYVTYFRDIYNLLGH